MSLSGEQLADELAGRLAVVRRYVEVRDGSQHERPESGELNATLRRCCGDGRGGKHASVDHNDIRLYGIGIDGGRQMARHRLSEDPCCCVIIGKALQMVIKCV